MKCTVLSFCCMPGSFPVSNGRHNSEPVWFFFLSVKELKFQYCTERGQQKNASCLKVWKYSHSRNTLLYIDECTELAFLPGLCGEVMKTCLSAQMFSSKHCSVFMFVSLIDDIFCLILSSFLTYSVYSICWASVFSFVRYCNN